MKKTLVLLTLLTFTLGTATSYASINDPVKTEKNGGGDEKGKKKKKNKKKSKKNSCCTKTEVKTCTKSAETEKKSCCSKQK